MPPETTAAPRPRMRGDAGRTAALAAVAAAAICIAALAAVAAAGVDGLPLPPFHNAAAQSPDTSPPALHGVAQSLNLNAAPPTLTLSFSENVLAAPLGAVPGANASLVEIAGVSGRPVIVLEGAAAGHKPGSQSAIVINLTAAQQAAASAAHRTTAPLSLSVRYGAVYDAAGNPFGGAASVGLNVVPDTTRPQAAGPSSQLNLTDGTIRMYFDEIIDAEAVDLGGMAVTVMISPSETVGTSMAGATASQGDAGELVIAMSDEQRLRLVGLRQTGAGSAAEAVQITATLTAVPDFAGNYWIGTLFSQNIPVVIDDRSGPALLHETPPLLNLRAGTLALYFDETVNRTSVSLALANVTHAGLPAHGVEPTTVNLAGARVASHADSDVLVIGLNASQAQKLRDAAEAVAAAAARAGGVSAAQAPGAKWNVSLAAGAASDLAGNPTVAVRAAPAAAAHAAPARHACMDAAAMADPCRYGILESYGEAAFWSGQAVAVSDDGSRSYVAYGPPPGSRAARVDAVGAAPAPAPGAPAGSRPVIASVEFEPPAPGVSSSVAALAVDGATGAPFAAVQEEPAGASSAVSATSYLAPFHPATLSETNRVQLSYMSHNGTSEGGDAAAAVGIDASRRLVLAAVSDGPADAAPYRSRGAVLSVDADALQAHAMYSSAPDPSAGYYHPYHAWRPSAMAVNETAAYAPDSAPTTAYVAGAAYNRQAALSGQAHPGTYGIHTIVFGNSSGFSPNYTSVHSLALAGPHTAPRPDAGSFVIESLALDRIGNALYAAYANGTLVSHPLARGTGAAAGYAVPSQGAAVAHGLAADGPGISVDSGRGLLYAVPSSLSSVLVYDLRAPSGRPSPAAEVPVPGPVSALAASASDGTVHVLGGLPGRGEGRLGAAAYVVGPGAVPLALAAPPSLDLRTGTLALHLDRRADAGAIDPSGIVLWGAGRASEPVRLAGAEVLQANHTAAPEIRLSEGQRRAAAAAHAWDGPLLLNASGGSVPGVFGAPLAAVASVPIRIAASPSNASIVSAAAASPYEVRVRYDAPVNATAALYGPLDFGPDGTRAVESVRGAGTAAHALAVAGPPLPADASGTLEVRRLPDLGSRSIFDGAAAVPVADAQRPSAVSAVVVDNASVAVFFDEPVAGADASSFGTISIGAQIPPATFEVARVSGSGPYRLLHVADGSPPVPRNAHGSLAVAASSFEDLAGNRGGSGGQVYVTPGRVTATTDGRAPVPATPGMYARTLVASTALGASLDLSPLGGLPLPADGPFTLDTFDVSVVLPPGASVAGGMPADGVLYVSGSSAEAGPRASIGGGRIMAMVDTGGAGGAPVRLGAPAAVVVHGAGGGVAFLQEPGGAPAAVAGTCGDAADLAVRPADVRAAAEAHLNGSGSCATDLSGDKIVVSFVLTTVGVAARPDAAVPGAPAAAICGDGGTVAEPDMAPPACAPPHIELLDTGGLAATAVAAAPAPPVAGEAGPQGTIFVAAVPAAGDRAASEGPSILVYDAASGPSPAASSALGAGRSVLALEAAKGAGAAGETSEAAAYAVVAEAGPEPGGAAPPPAVFARINAGGAAGPGGVGLEYVDARGRDARVGASDRIAALHVGAAGDRAYVAVLANASARGGLGDDGPILVVDTAAGPGALLRQHAAPYDPRAAAGAYYYPAEAWRPTALAVHDPGLPEQEQQQQAPAAYAVGARLLPPAGEPADPASGPESYGVQAVSFAAGAGDPPAFTPNYTLSGEAGIARLDGAGTGGSGGGGGSPAAAVPGLPAAGAALDAAGEKLYVLYGNGTLFVYAVNSTLRSADAAPPPAPAPAPAPAIRPLYVLDEIGGPSALAASGDGAILYAAGSGGIRAYDMRADMLVGSLGIGIGVVDMDAAIAGTLYAAGRDGSVRAIGEGAAPAELRPSALELLAAATPDGGTAHVAPGRYDNVSLVLDRPIRLAADPQGSAVFGPSSRISVLVPPSGTVAVEGIVFNGTRCPAGADPSAPGSATIRVTDGARAAPSQDTARAGGSVAILSNTFSGTCGAAVYSDAASAAGLAVRSNTIESAGSAAASVAVSGLGGRLSIESNRVFGAAGYGASVHNVSGAIVSGNHVEDAAGGINASSSSAVRVTGNTFSGLAGPAVLARDARPADASSAASGILSDGLAATLNTVYGTAVALSVLGADPAAQGAAAAQNGSAVRVDFNFNMLYPHGDAAPLISSSAPGAAVDARANYYPGLDPGSYPRTGGSAPGSIAAVPAAAPPGPPLRIGILLDAPSMPYIDGPAAEAVRAAADEANRRAVAAAADGGLLLPPVELVEAGGGAGAGSADASGNASALAARSMASGAAADGKVVPVLLRRIAEVESSWNASQPDEALAKIAAAPYRGHVLFAADASGTVLAAGAGPDDSIRPGLPHPAAAADPAAFADAVGRLESGSAGATAWIGHERPNGSVVRTLLSAAAAAGGDLLFGASYDAGRPPTAYVGPMSAAGLAAAAAALPAGTPIISPGAVDGRIVAAAGPSVFSMAPASAAASAPVAGQIISEERVAAVIPVVQADGYSQRFAKAALDEYESRLPDGTVMDWVSFEPSEASDAFWSAAADGMDNAASGLARGGLGPYEIAVLYVGGEGPFEALAGQALARPPLAGAQWYAGDAIAQATQAGAAASGTAGPPPWHAPGGAENATSAEELSRRTALVAFSLEPARGLAAEPSAAASAASILGEVRLRLDASALPHRGAALPSAPQNGTLSTAYAYLAHDAVLVLAWAVPAAEAEDPEAPDYGASIRQAAASSPGGGPSAGAVVRRAAFDAGGSLAYPVPYAIWTAAPSGPPVRAGTIASPPATCGISLADGRLDFGGVLPGNASAPQAQEIINAGTALLGTVSMDAADWTAPAGTDAGAGAPALPAGLTEVAVGRLPPGAPPPAAQPGAFSPVSGDADVLSGLAPGNSVQLRFVLNLTSVGEAPPSAVEQAVTYTASCE